MQIIIDIPKDVYKETLRTEIWNDYEKRAIRFAIRNCTKLPKRHGDLKDMSNLHLTREDPIYSEKDVERAISSKVEDVQNALDSLYNLVCGQYDGVFKGKDADEYQRMLQNIRNADKLLNEINEINNMLSKER